MPIHRLLENDAAFTPHDIAVVVSAYEAALAKLGLQKRDDRTTQLVARAIIEVAQHGERDPETICDRAIKALSK
jgi:non-ribosomal peptide synthetase component F